MRNRKKKNIPFTEQEVGKALESGDFLSVRLMDGPDFGNRPWVLLSSMPELDQEIASLNKIYKDGAKIRLLPILVFDERTNGPVIPFRRLAPHQAAFSFDFATIQELTDIVKKVAAGMAAEAAPHPTPTTDNEISEAVDSGNKKMLEARNAAIQVMYEALASATRLGLRNEDVRSAVESFAQQPRSGAKLLLPTSGGGTTEIELPPLEALRAVRAPPVVNQKEYAGIVTGYDESSDLLFLDGRTAIEGYSKVWTTRPALGEVLVVTGVQIKDVVLRRISVTKIVSEQPDLLITPT